MPYEMLGHTADARMHVKAGTLEELFREALRGMMAFARPKEKERGEIVLRHFTLRAPDAAALLIDFLNEALTFAHIHREWYSNVHFLTFSKNVLEGEFEGRMIEEFGEDIKAVTYHEAEIRKNEKGELETAIVFDI